MNTKIRVQNLDENKAVLLLRYCDLEIALAQCTDDGDIYGTGLTDHKFFRQTSSTLQMDRKEVRRLYYSFTSEETGQTLDIIILVYDSSLRVKFSPNSKFHHKTPHSLCLYLIKYIDTNHAKRKKLACREILYWIRKKHAVYCSKHTLS